MKKIFLFLCIGYAIFSLIGCTSLQQIILPSPPAEPTVGVRILPFYSGPKARIAVENFNVKAAKINGEIGPGLYEMFSAALINSNRFSVVAHQVAGIAKDQQAPSVSGETDLANHQRQNEIRVADLIISAAVVEFKPQASGGRSGVGGGGGVGSGVWGGLSSSALNKAVLALDIRLVDASSSEILAATRVEGQASDISGAIMTGLLEGWGLGSGLSVYANTPTEKAIRICIIEAVKYISQSVPTEYYKY
ncbi:MAG: CsgG/HfaB family protein [Candidatus Omnitrophota bacterium]